MVLYKGFRSFQSKETDPGAREALRDANDNHSQQGVKHCCEYFLWGVTSRGLFLACLGLKARN
jgi:hypothetical protein